MSERALVQALCFGVIAVGLVAFGLLLFVSAPYGRHVRKGWGPTVTARQGWTVMESPSVLVFAGVFALGDHAGEGVPLFFAALWLTHYVHRAFIYPRRMKGAGKAMPASVVLMAVVFNCVNAYVNARWLSALGSYPAAWLHDPRFLLGSVAFGGGWLLNLLSDNILIGLRRRPEDGYRIPEGGAYRWVSSPNYLGELVAWGGFAVATWSLPALSFFLFSTANLLPRALSNHRWYRDQFPEYPKERRALIPWLL